MQLKLPKLIAIDLDETLLTTDKKLSVANRDALIEIARNNILLAFASGRLGSAMKPFTEGLPIDIAMLTLNGAAVYNGAVCSANLVYEALLPSCYAEELIKFCEQVHCACNYYIDDTLYSQKNEKSERWINHYYTTTKINYTFIESFSIFRGKSPSKIIIVCEKNELDSIQAYFKNKWKYEIYICRATENNLEFLNKDAGKGNGMIALAEALQIDLKDIVVFGDAENDITMFQKCGFSIAMKNASDEVKKTASFVSPWTNNENGVAKVWELLKQGQLSGYLKYL